MTGHRDGRRPLLEPQQTWSPTLHHPPYFWGVERGVTSDSFRDGNLQTRADADGEATLGGDRAEGRVRACAVGTWAQTCSTVLG